MIYSKKKIFRRAIMIKCPECGIEYNDDTIQCSFCGYNFKETPNKTVETEKISPGKSKFNANAIFLGTLVYSTSMFLIMILMIFLSLYYPLNLFIIFPVIVIPLVIGNILACWIGNTDYNQSMLNGGIIGMLPVGVLLLFGIADFGILATFFILGALFGVLAKFITSKIVKPPRKDSRGKIRFAILFLFVIMLGIFSALTLFGSPDNMTYDNNGISFNYLGKLAASDNPGNVHPFGTGNNLTVIAALNGINGTAAQSDNLIISKGPATLPLADYVAAEKASIQKSNCTINSSTNLTVDGVPATEIDYNNTSGITGMDLLLIKNNSFYRVNFNYNGDYYDLQRFTVFLMVENSLHIK
jgi:hypothetical protein